MIIISEIRHILKCNVIQRRMFAHEYTTVASGKKKN